MNINYIWIGPPKDNGQDTAGPLAMIAALGPGDNVVFWCPDAHVAAYQAAFGDARITVRGIEGYLAAHADDAVYGGAVGQMQAMLAAAAAAPEGSVLRRREIMNAKNAFDFLLAAMEGGFVMDTNVRPDPDRPLNLVEPPRFMAPFAPWVEDDTEYDLPYAHYNVTGDQTLYGSCAAGFDGSLFLNALESEGQATFHRATDNNRRPDVWLLYSPQHDAHARAAFRAFAWRWRILQTFREDIGMEPSDADLESYRRQCGSAAVEAVIDALAHSPGGVCGTIDPAHAWTFTTTSGPGGNFGFIHDLGIKKKFDGSHRPPATPAAAETVIVGDLDAGTTTTTTTTVPSAGTEAEPLLDNAAPRMNLFGRLTSCIASCFCLGPRGGHAHHH